MAAESAAEVSTKDVRVIKSKTIPQGFAAMMYLHPDGDINQVESAMIDAISSVETGEVTTAVRDVEIDGVQVKENEIITLLNGKLISSTKNLEEAVMNFMDSIAIDEYELITLFYGENIDKAIAESIANALQEKFDDFEVDLQYGGQPHYQFIISVE
jgi:dihydroxyacetone kinase-like predicted kinase